MMAAASVAVRPLLAGPARPATVLGAFPTATYLAVDDTVLALVTGAGVRLPNAVLVPSPLAGPALVGDGAVVVDGVEVRVDRWWDPRPLLGPVRPERVEELGALLGPLDPSFAAFAADPVAEAPRLVGLGPGLTPAGDDVLAGATATLRLRGSPLADPLAEVCRTARTTALSAALLACATRGQVALPVAALLLAVTGRGPIEPALDALLRVGHTSGRDLATGVLIGLRS